MFKSIIQNKSWKKRMKKSGNKDVLSFSLNLAAPLELKGGEIFNFVILKLNL